MLYSLEKITALTGARLLGNGWAEISRILTDSRSLCFPEDSLFFALKSRRNDGHDYIPELYRRGVRSFVVARLPEDIEKYPDAGFLLTESPLVALQRLAESHRRLFDIPVVGITGSNGKTVVKEWLYQLLSPDTLVTRSPRSYNSQIGVPLSVWALNERSGTGIFEAGISQPGEMAALQRIIRPAIGVFTCLGDAHQENFLDEEQKCREKMQLFRDAEVLVYSLDAPCVAACASQSGFRGEHLGWSFRYKDAPLFISEAAKGETQTRISYIYKGMEGVCEIPFIDDASVENAVSCLAVCLYLNQSVAVIAERMARLEPVAMRLEVKEGRNGCTLINDSYNSDINSLDIALDFMNRRPDNARRRRTLILSDMAQTGQSADALYRHVAHLVATRGVEHFIGVGPCLKAAAGEFTVEAEFFDTTDELLSSGLPGRLHDAVVLVKGARAFRFDAVTEQLTLKIHETTLEVNLNAVVNNLNHYRSFMPADTRMICMVKASAYGAGAVEIAKTLQDHRVDYLAVAVADEGVDLRKAGITANIMIMNPEMNCFRTLFEYDLEPEVYSFRLLDALIREAEREGLTHFPIHVKLDTGMHRLGFDPVNDMPKLVERLKRQTAVLPRSVFSHFVGSDSDDFDDFSRRQYELFLTGSEALQQAFPHKILRHICNSAGIVHFPHWHLEMARLGLGLYGIDSRTNKMLHNVSTLRTTILQIHDVPREDTVGYSRRGRLQRDSRIAALPIGYADGLDRKLGNGNAYCLVNGCRAPYVGNICMDVCMIDVTGIDCREGDSVVIFGDDLPVTVLSDAAGTIPYEILTGISSRVKRIYFQD